MSTDIAKGESVFGYQSQQAPAINVPLLLILAGALIGLILAVYSHGCVFATLTATQRPNVRAQALSRQHFRGLPIYIFHRLVKTIFLSRFPTKGSSLLKCVLLNLTAELLLSGLKVGNIHAILTQRLDHPYYRRLPSRSAWYKAFPAILLYSIASSICFYLPVYFIKLAGALGEELEVSETTQLICVFTTIVILYFGAVVPTYAIFIRVAASVQGNESMSLKSAWHSFPWSARVHFFKLLAEVLAMETGISIILCLFVFALFHPELHDAVFQFFVKYSG